MGRKRKKYPKLKKMNPEDLTSLLERVRNNIQSAEDRDLLVNMVETMKFITDNLDQEDAEFERLLKEVLDIKS